MLATRAVTLPSTKPGDLVKGDVDIVVDHIGHHLHRCRLGREQKRPAGDLPRPLDFNSRSLSIGPEPVLRPS